jgi:hypothetical protein
MTDTEVAVSDDISLSVNELEGLDDPGYDEAYDRKEPLFGSGIYVSSESRVYNWLRKGDDSGK